MTNDAESTDQHFVCSAVLNSYPRCDIDVLEFETAGEG